MDANGNRTTMLYDAASRPTGFIDALSRRLTYGYDAAGRQTLRIDARGNRTTDYGPAARVAVIPKGPYVPATVG